MRKNYRLRRFDEAYMYASRVNSRLELIEFGKAALHHLENNTNSLCANNNVKIQLYNIKKKKANIRT